MTKEENRQRIRNEALNKIKKLYHPKTKHDYTYYDGEGSLMEQISFDVQSIIREMERQLNKNT
jgi:hypothetical protein